MCIHINTYTARSGCWSGWISDSYCCIKPLCSGMGEVVPAHTSPTLLPHPLALCCNYPVSKCFSASIIVTSTVRVKAYACNNMMHLLRHVGLLCYILCKGTPSFFHWTPITPKGNALQHNVAEYPSTTAHGPATDIYIIGGPRQTKITISNQLMHNNRKQSNY